jgi:thiamine biosynthesis lipoprotein
VTSDKETEDRKQESGELKRSDNKISLPFRLLFVCLLAAAPLAPASEPGLHVVRRAHYVMGTVFEIEAYGKDAERTAAAVEESFAAIRRADEILSDYRDDSELSRLNRDGAQGSVHLSADLFAVLRKSVEYSRLTDGAFDVTVGPAVDAWRRASKEGRMPNDGERSRWLSLVSHSLLRFDDSQQAARFDRPGMRVDLGGIGKGWAVDRAVEILRQRGIEHALISAGTSSVYALGAPPGQTAWKVAIRHPQREDDHLAVVLLRDESLSTSANYEQSHEVAGKAYSHILDPRTGWPVEGMWSSTVIASEAAESDALSTAAFVLGLERAEAMLRKRGLAAILAGQAGAGRAGAGRAGQGSRGNEMPREMIVRRIVPAGKTPPWITAPGGKFHE